MCVTATASTHCHLLRIKDKYIRSCISQRCTFHLAPFNGYTTNTIKVRSGLKVNGCLFHLQHTATYYKAIYTEISSVKRRNQVPKFTVPRLICWRNKEQLLVCQIMRTVLVAFVCVIKPHGPQIVYNTEHVQKTRHTTKQSPDPFLLGSNVAQLLLGLPNIHDHTSAPGS
jgi:hypothetical protein